MCMSMIQQIYVWREREMVTVWGVSSLERQRAGSLQINATILSGTVIIHSMQPQFPQSRERWSQCGFPHYRGRGFDRYMLWQSWVWNCCVYLGEISLLLRGLFYNSALQIEWERERDLLSSPCWSLCCIPLVSLPLSLSPLFHQGL